MHTTTSSMYFSANSWIHNIIKYLVCTVYLLYEDFHSCVQLEKTPEYDRICKLLSQPFRLGSSSRDSPSATDPKTAQQKWQQNSTLSQRQQHQKQQQQQQQKQLEQQQQQYQQQFKHHQQQQQLKNQQQHQRQLKQQQKSQIQQQQQYNLLGRTSSSTQQNGFGMQNTNRRANYRVRTCVVAVVRRRSVSKQCRTFTAEQWVVLKMWIIVKIETITTMNDDDCMKPAIALLMHKSCCNVVYTYST